MRRHRKAEVRIVIGDAGRAWARRRHRGHRAGVAATRSSSSDLHRVYAYVLAFNPRGRRAFEKAGFALEGTLRDDRFDGDGFVDTLSRCRALAVEPCCTSSAAMPDLSIEPRRRCLAQRPTAC